MKAIKGTCNWCQGTKKFREKNIKKFKSGGKAFVCDDCLNPDPRLKKLKK